MLSMLGQSFSSFSWELNPEENPSLQENYCRNPNGGGKAYCYTEGKSADLALDKAHVASNETHIPSCYPFRL
jgi:hypothetical protein